MLFMAQPFRALGSFFRFLSCCGSIMAPHCEKSVMVTLFFPENFILRRYGLFTFLFKKATQNSGNLRFIFKALSKESCELPSAPLCWHKYTRICWNRRPLLIFRAKRENGAAFRPCRFFNKQVLFVPWFSRSNLFQQAAFFQGRPQSRAQGHGNRHGQHGV